MSDRLFRFSIYAAGFVLGFILMGFEMLGSRYLNPYFGSGIYTWAALISVTLFSLMVGYFFGGRLVDRIPSVSLLGALVLLAALSMALIPPLIEPMIIRILDAVADERAGVTIAALFMLFVPLTLISCFSPFAVRILLVATHASGRQTGAVYGISTFGNIFGTLATTFWLIPNVGSRDITALFAGATAVVALFLILIGRLRSES